MRKEQTILSQYFPSTSGGTDNFGMNIEIFAQMITVTYFCASQTEHEINRAKLYYLMSEDKVQFPFYELSLKITRDYLRLRVKVRF